MIAEKIIGSIIPPVIDKVLQDCIDSMVRKEEFTTYDVKKIPMALKGEGFLAKPYNIHIKGRTGNGEKEINIFAKVAISNSSLETAISMQKCYLNECFMYKEISNVFKYLQNNACIPEQERYKMIKCFEESTSEVILSENVSVLGFKTCNRMEVVNVKFMELAFKQIAKFHALGFVMQKKMPDYFKKKIRSMEHIFQFNDTLYAAFKPLLKITTNKLRPEIKEKVKKYQLKCLEKFEKHLKDTDSIGTLCHGDFRANNLLVKEVDGKITEVIPIDYQICHYGCPANDILLLMYGCTDQKFRKAYKIHLINLYYQHLGEFLNYFDIEVAEVYPRKEFDGALTERADYGLVIALYYYAAYFARDDDVPDITEGFTHISYDLDDEIVKRIEEIVEEYDEEENNLKKYSDIE